MRKIGEAVIRVARRSTLYENYTIPTETTSGFGDNFQILFRLVIGFDRKRIAF